jgi:DNA adenine methylase
VPPNLVIYPGGKGRRLPHLRPHLARILEGADSFDDVFCGGGSVTLDVAARYPNVRLHVNDLDPMVAARWRTTVAEDDVFEQFLRLLPSMLTPGIVTDAEAVVAGSADDVALAAAGVILSRAKFSGNRLGGSRSDINVRWVRTSLEREARRERSLLRGRLTVSSLDFREYFESLGPPSDGRAIYLDPPYVAAGPDLYPHAFDDDDHEALAALVAQHPRVVVSYDDHPLARRLYGWATCCEIEARYDGSRKEATELVFTNVRGAGAATSRKASTATVEG